MRTFNLRTFYREPISMTTITRALSDGKIVRRIDGYTMKNGERKLRFIVVPFRRFVSNNVNEMNVNCRCAFVSLISSRRQFLREKRARSVL